MVADSSLYIPEQKIGSRIECCGFLGTVKYIGPVEGHPGVWLGVEWDEVSRGKHNGTVNGVYYFETSQSNSGSFVRKEKVNFGQTAIKSIVSRYGNVSDLEINEQQRLQFQQLTNAPFLEMVGFEKIAQKQSDFDALQVVNLRLQHISSPGGPLELKNLCPNVKELDISKNLLNSWDDIFDICSQLENLRFLNVCENFLKIPTNYEQFHYPNIKILVCGNMNINWNDIEKITTVFSNVEELRLPYNNINELNVSNPQNFTSLKILDLEGNNISKWSEIEKLSIIPNLQDLNLENTQLTSVEFKGTCEKVTIFENLKKLNLKDNLIKDWESIGELNKLKQLDDLRIMKNPILETENAATRTQLIIAKIANLKFLNGSAIKPDERRGSEYDYIKKYGLEWLEIKDTSNREEFLKKHHRYFELIQKYGNPEESELKIQSNILNSALINLNITFKEKQIKKRFPPSLLVQKLVMLVQKLFKLEERPSLMYRSSAETDIEILLNDEMKEIGFYSIQDGDTIVVLVSH